MDANESQHVHRQQFTGMQCCCFYCKHNYIKEIASLIACFAGWRPICQLLGREFVSQASYAWTDSKQASDESSEGHQPLGQCPAADREEVWQALYALHSLYEVSRGLVCSASF